jgi:hypothetical protein
MKRIDIRLATEEVIQRAISDDSLEGAMIEIQDAIGQDDGGICSLHWSGKDDHDEYWKSLDHKNRREEIIKYLDLEELYSGLVLEASFSEALDKAHQIMVCLNKQKQKFLLSTEYQQRLNNAIASLWDVIDNIKGAKATV